MGATVRRQCIQCGNASSFRDKLGGWPEGCPSGIRHVSGAPDVRATMGDGLVKSDRLVTVFGGSGFVWRDVVRALARQGWRVRVAVRRPDLAFHLQPLGDVGQIHAVQANVRYPDSVAHALRDAEAAVNLVGILHESGVQRFDALHNLGAQTVAKAAKDAGTEVFVQMSAIGADPASSSAYANTKAFGEQAVRIFRPDAIIMRPSVVFGPEDQFFN